MFFFKITYIRLLINTLLKVSRYSSYLFLFLLRMLTVVTAPALTASSATSSQIGATSSVLTAFFTVVTVFVVFFTVPVPLSFSPSPFPFPFPSSFLPAPAVPLPPVVLPSLSMVISPFPESIHVWAIFLLGEFFYSPTLLPYSFFVSLLLQTVPKLHSVLIIIMVMRHVASII